jgi:hypothetical protein
LQARPAPNGGAVPLLLTDTMILTLPFLPALYVAWFRIKEPIQREVDRADTSDQLLQAATN